MQLKEDNKIQLKEGKISTEIKVKKQRKFNMKSLKTFHISTIQNL